MAIVICWPCMRGIAPDCQGRIPIHLMQTEPVPCKQGNEAAGWISDKEKAEAEEYQEKLRQKAAREAERGGK